MVLPREPEDIHDWFPSTRRVRSKEAHCRLPNYPGNCSLSLQGSQACNLKGSLGCHNLKGFIDVAARARPSPSHAEPQNDSYLRVCGGGVDGGDWRQRRALLS